MSRSDGISIRDSYSSPTAEDGACAAYGGPWVRWSVIRNNSMGGISQASLNQSAKTGQPPSCAGVSLFNALYQLHSEEGTTSDIVAEQNAFECPANGMQNASGYHLVLDGGKGSDGFCSNCVVRP